MSSEIKHTREVMPLFGINRDLKIGDILPSEEIARITHVNISMACDQFITVDCRYFVKPKEGEAPHA